MPTTKTAVEPMFARCVEAATRIDGWYDDHELLLLVRSAYPSASQPDGLLVELGSYKGGGTYGGRAEAAT